MARPLSAPVQAPSTTFSATMDVPRGAMDNPTPDITTRNTTEIVLSSRSYTPADGTDADHSQHGRAPPTPASVPARGDFRAQHRLLAIDSAQTPRRRRLSSGRGARRIRAVDVPIAVGVELFHDLPQFVRGVVEPERAHAPWVNARPSTTPAPVGSAGQTSRVRRRRRPSVSRRRGPRRSPPRGCPRVAIAASIFDAPPISLTPWWGAVGPRDPRAIGDVRIRASPCTSAKPS